MGGYTDNMGWDNWRWGAYNIERTNYNNLIQTNELANANIVSIISTPAFTPHTSLPTSHTVIVDYGAFYL